MIQLADDLKAARALIDTREKWAATTAELMRGHNCIVTALDRVSFERHVPMQHALERALPRGAHKSQPTSSLRLSHFNDSRRTTHADIMALFDRAIAAAEAAA
jgi:hypothetical protein